MDNMENKYFVGQTVYHWKYGSRKGIVVELQPILYGVKVQFGEETMWFTKDGKGNVDDPTPNLSYTPYTLTKGGFSQNYNEGENFFVGNRFFHDIEDLIHHLEEDGDIKDQPDDWYVSCMQSKLEPIFTVTADQIMDRVDEFRFPEDWDDDKYNIRKILDDNINYEVINDSLPKFYYPNPRKIFQLSKKDLLQ